MITSLIFISLALSFFIIMVCIIALCYHYCFQIHKEFPSSYPASNAHHEHHIRSFIGLAIPWPTKRRTDRNRESEWHFFWMMWSFESDTRNRNQIFNFYYVRAHRVPFPFKVLHLLLRISSHRPFLPFRMCTYKLGISKIKKTEEEYSPESLIHSHSCTRQAAKCKAPQRHFSLRFYFNVIAQRLSICHFPLFSSYAPFIIRTFPFHNNIQLIPFSFMRLLIYFFVLDRAFRFTFLVDSHASSFVRASRNLRQYLT